MNTCTPQGIRRHAPIGLVGMPSWTWPACLYYLGLPSGALSGAWVCARGAVDVQGATVVRRHPLAWVVGIVGDGEGMGKSGRCGRGATALTREVLASTEGGMIMPHHPRHGTREFQLVLTGPKSPVEFRWRNAPATLWSAPAALHAGCNARCGQAKHRPRRRGLRPAHDPR